MATVYMLLALVVGAAIVAAAKVRGMVLELRHLRAVVAALPAGEQPAAAPAAQLATIPPAPMAGAGAALASPPADFRLVMDALRAKGAGRYRVPLGWYASVDGPELATAQLVGDVNHMLITGQSDAGKDNAALGMILALAQQYPPSAVQFAIVDGKGLDWMDWAGRAHCWHLATDPEQIAPAMAALTAERQRRRDILAAAGAKKWDVYRGEDLPLLVVYVSELLLLQNATSKAQLAAWLGAELTSARAMGIRYIIAAQNASNFDTQWRSQVSLFLAGYQPLPSSDQPNTGYTTADAEALGVVPPSRLPAPASGAAGVFCAVQGATGMNVRASLIPDAQAEYLVRALPAKPLHHEPAGKGAASPGKAEAPALPGATDPMLAALLSGAPLPFVDERSSAALAALEAAGSAFAAAGSGSASASVAGIVEPLPVAVEIVPADEQRAILELAKRVNSRRALCKQLYDGATGGKAYAKVQAVCDAAGLLLPPATPQAVAA